jgi:hypothetical protein
MSWAFHSSEPWLIVIGQTVNYTMHEQYVKRFKHINNSYKRHVENKHRPNKLKHNNQTKKQSLVHVYPQWSRHFVAHV